MQTGTSTLSGDRIKGYTSTTTTANTTLTSHINLSDANWLLAFSVTGGTQFPKPQLPGGSRIFIQPSGGTATLAGGVVVPDGTIVTINVSNADNVPITLSAGTLRITVEC